MADEDTMGSYTPSGLGRGRRTPRRKGLGLKSARSTTDLTSRTHSGGSSAAGDESPKSDGSGGVKRHSTPHGDMNPEDDVDGAFLALLDRKAAEDRGRKKSVDDSEADSIDLGARRRLDVGDSEARSERSPSIGSVKPPLTPKLPKLDEKRSGSPVYGTTKWESADMIKWLRWLDLDPQLPQDEALLYFAEVGMKSQLPYPWEKKEGVEGEESTYVNTMTMEVLPHHPLVPSLKAEISAKRLGNSTATDSTLSSSIAGLMTSDLDFSVSDESSSVPLTPAISHKPPRGDGGRQSIEVARLRRRNEQLEAQIHALTLKLDMVQKNRAAELEQLKYEFENRLRASLAGMDAERERWQIDREQVGKEMEGMRRKHADELRGARGQSHDELTSMRQKMLEERDKEINDLETKHKIDLDVLRERMTIDTDARIEEMRSIMESKKKIQEEELRAAREQGSAHASLDALTKTVSKSAASLETLRLQAEAEVKASLEQRSYMLDRREEEVKQMTLKLANEQKRVDEERQQLIELQANQQQEIVARQHELQVDRNRLSKEHARLEALQVALQAERDSTARTLAEERSELDELRRERVREHDRFARESEEERRIVSRERAQMNAEAKRLAEKESISVERIKELEHRLSEERANFEQMMADSRPETIQREREKLEQDVAHFKQDSADLADMATTIQSKSSEVRTMYEHALAEREKAESLNMTVTRIRDALEQEKVQLEHKEQAVQAHVRKMENERAQIARDLGMLRQEKIRRTKESITAADLLNAHMGSLLESSVHIPERENSEPTASSTLSMSLPPQPHPGVSSRTSQRLAGVLNDVQDDLSDLEKSRRVALTMMDKQAHFLSQMNKRATVHAGDRSTMRDSFTPLLSLASTMREEGEITREDL